MATVYCLCGKVGSGKTEYARSLREKANAVVLNVDDLMQPLFGETIERETLDAKFSVCRDYLYRLADQILAAGISMIFDFGFWKREGRREAVERFAGYRVKFVYFPIDDAEQLRRIGRRNESDAKTYSFTPEAVADLNRLFEPPDAAAENIDVDIVPRRPS